jgi:hypothetical protein
MRESDQSSSARVTEMMGQAWAAWNASYHEVNVDDYRTLALSLYQQDLHDRIARQFAYLDEQNARLDEIIGPPA